VGRGEEREQREPGEHVVADREEEEREAGRQRPAEEDHRPPAEVVGEVAAEVRGAGGGDRAEEQRRPERALARAEVLDRPDAEEREARRAGDRAGELDGEHRPQGTVDVAAPDEVEQAAEHFGHANGGMSIFRTGCCRSGTLERFQLAA
jgi:hypothetical protein